MPLYAVSLRQARDRSGQTLYKWSNRFFTDAPNALNAATRGAIWWESALREASRSDCWCYEVYATDVTPPDAGGTPTTADYATIPVPSGVRRGNLTTQSSEPHAYWRDMAIIVELRVLGSRPDRKFWRPGFQEADFGFTGAFENTNLAGAVLAAFTDALDLGEWRSGDGEPVASISVRRVVTRRLGRLAFIDLPPPPPTS